MAVGGGQELLGVAGSPAYAFLCRQEGHLLWPDGRGQLWTQEALAVYEVLGLVTISSFLFTWSLLQDFISSCLTGVSQILVCIRFTERTYYNADYCLTLSWGFRSTEGSLGPWYRWSMGQILWKSVSLATWLIFCFHPSVTSICHSGCQTELQSFPKHISLCHTSMLSPLPSIWSVPSSMKSYDFSRSRLNMVSSRKPSLVFLGLKLRGTVWMKKSGRE